MGSGFIQILSYGKQDAMFYKKPTITYFKSIYKRHTNFASQSMPQNFSIKPDFGQKVSCTVANLADLIGKSYLCVELPPIGNFLDVRTDTGSGNSSIACCAWSEKIGYKLIKNIELEIDNKVIERHPSDYFNVINELNKNDTQETIDKMIGNVPELNTFTNSKNSYKLIIPLNFWFCKYSNMAFPLMAAYNSTVKINVEFSTLDECLILGPTHYVIIEDEICLFERGQNIYQNINGIIYSYKFIYHDPIDKKLYYVKISKEHLKSNVKMYSDNNYTVLPIDNERLYLNKKKYFNQILNLTLNNTFLWIDFIFLESKERKKFIEYEIDYIISVVQYDNERTIYHSSDTIKINHSNPCSEIIFNCSSDYIENGYMKDKFNYCNDVNKIEDNIISATLIMNGQERLTEQSSTFFNLSQPLKYHSSSVKGLCCYSFSVNLNSFQFAGYCNFSQITDAELKLKLNKNVSNNRPVQFRLYTISLRKLTISNGIVKME